MTEAEERHQHNVKVIEEFRSSGGHVGMGPTLLLTTTGAKTGQDRTVPVMYMADGERLLIFGSRAGSDKHPDWYHNLLKNAAVTVEVGVEKYKARATPLAGEERDRLYAEQARRYPVFAEYQSRTKRVIPVVALQRID